MILIKQKLFDEEARLLQLQLQLQSSPHVLETEIAKARVSGNDELVKLLESLADNYSSLISVAKIAVRGFMPYMTGIEIAGRPEEFTI